MKTLQNGLQRLTFFFEANSTKSEEKKRATFIAVVSDKTYETLLGLLAPAEPSGVVFIDIMNKLGEYYSPKHNIIVERFKFYDCVKSETETMSQYLARLKCLARTCNFGKDEEGAALTPQAVLEECLRDKFVWEMKKNTKVQQRLLSETNLTYAKTVKLASTMELAQQGVDCVSGTVTKLKPDILKFSTTKQHNKSNQPRKHSVSNNKPTKPCLDVLLRNIRHMSASIKHTLVRTVRRLVIFSQIVLLRKRRKKIQRSKTMSTFLMTMIRWHIHYTMFPVVQHHTKQISS